ncbi:CBM9 family sugar-binding protein [Muricauda sp. SCSIO 64092]|uniref:CBM9 family sugar-binding protein n=1 Tax=Allomuricauda sp. SCSIO 64092 TaxID=2908842 RepID=UPI001FF618D5|nr:CBM9 family sugar-binding protein [Muricauda sp. SCSIO 64092]UOY04920.1 CBM9 family sugar-binding protein [Muricauda sp. SCSIO 64092]
MAQTDNDLSNTYHVVKIEPANGVTAVDWPSVKKLMTFRYHWESVEDTLVFQGTWDGIWFYFRFEVQDENILVYHSTEHKTEVAQSDRVEIFFRKDAKLNPYYCLEMDPDKRILDYATMYYRQYNKGWSWPPGHLQVDTGRLKNGYYVQGKISIASLKELDVWNNGKVQTGLYRGNCISLKDGKAELRWSCWIDPRTENPDFHVASSFGILDFMDQ